MKTMIDKTIKEIISSVLQFDADIKKNNPAGLSKFINGFYHPLERFKSLVQGSEIYYPDFYDEFSGLFYYFFEMGKISEVANNLFKLEENEGIVGSIAAIKRNGNPLRFHFKSSGGDLFKDFVDKYQTPSNKKIKPTLINTLEEACNQVAPEAYELATKWFIKEDLVYPDTLEWKDKKNGYKTVLIKYICSLNGAGYTEELTPIEIMNIVQNTFKKKISKSLAEHVKTTDYNGIKRMPPLPTLIRLQ
jgi:hypothetical protein